MQTFPGEVPSAPPIADSTVGDPLLTGRRDTVIPVIQEEAFVTKRAVDTEKVRVQTSVETEQVLVHDTVSRGAIEITRVAVEREVAEAPEAREVDGVMIIPVFEERLVVEKRLFLVEEIHIRRTATAEPVSLPASIRRTRVDIQREDLTDTKETV